MCGPYCPLITLGGTTGLTTRIPYRSRRNRKKHTMKKFGMISLAAVAVGTVCCLVVGLGLLKSFTGPIDGTDNITRHTAKTIIYSQTPNDCIELISDTKSIDVGTPYLDSSNSCDTFGLSFETSTTTTTTTTTTVPVPPDVIDPLVIELSPEQMLEFCG